MGWAEFTEVAFKLCLVASAIGLIGAVYALIGGTKLWGPERGVPFCGHPFEQTWLMNPKPVVWWCPKCCTPFELHEGDDGVRRWVPHH